jgi:hypothetical protein
MELCKIGIIISLPTGSIGRHGVAGQVVQQLECADCLDIPNDDSPCVITYTNSTGVKYRSTTLTIFI